MTRLLRARRGVAGRSAACQGKARRRRSGRGVPGQGAASPVGARRARARRGVAGRGAACRGKARRQRSGARTRESAVAFGAPDARFRGTRVPRPWESGRQGVDVRAFDDCPRKDTGPRHSRPLPVTRGRLPPADTTSRHSRSRHTRPPPGRVHHFPPLAVPSLAAASRPRTPLPATRGVSRARRPEADHARRGGTGGSSSPLYQKPRV